MVINKSSLWESASNFAGYWYAFVFIMERVLYQFVRLGTCWI